MMGGDVNSSVPATVKVVDGANAENAEADAAEAGADAVAVAVPKPIELVAPSYLHTCAEYPNISIPVAVVAGFAGAVLLFGWFVQLAVNGLADSETPYFSYFTGAMWALAGLTGLSAIVILAAVGYTLWLTRRLSLRSRPLGFWAAALSAVSLGPCAYALNAYVFHGFSPTCGVCVGGWVMLSLVCAITGCCVALFACCPLYGCLRQLCECCDSAEVAAARVAAGIERDRIEKEAKENGQRHNSFSI